MNILCKTSIILMECESMTVKLEQYRIFKAIADTGNISRTAKQLYLSQSAVSQSLQQLESALGVRLFSRTARGVTLTAEVLCEEYRKLNALYYGDDVVLDDEIALEWARIPHFYYNYYVFQYATSFSAAVAIANRILKEGAPAVADYKKFLSGGCSTDPISLLKIAGVDMSSPEPVNSALALFGELVDELAELL